MVEQLSKPDKFSQKCEMSPFFPSPLPSAPCSIIWRSVKWLSNKTHSTWWYVSPLATRHVKTCEANMPHKCKASSVDITPDGLVDNCSHKLPRRTNPWSHCTLSSLNKLLEERVVCCGHFSGSLLGSSESTLIWFNRCSIPSDRYFTASSFLLPGPFFCWHRANPR